MTLKGVCTACVLIVVMAERISEATAYPSKRQTWHLSDLARLANADTLFEHSSTKAKSVWPLSSERLPGHDRDVLDQWSVEELDRQLSKVIQGQCR